MLGLAEDQLSLLLSSESTDTKGKRKKRIGKRETLRKLREENDLLKSLTSKLEQDITAIEAQNALLKTQVGFFMKTDEPQNSLKKQSTEKETIPNSQDQESLTKINGPGKNDVTF